MGNEPRLGSKVFYKIGEVSQVTKLPAYVLRFWESQFPFLKPKKSRGNQRLYVRKDVETVLEVKRRRHRRGQRASGNGVPLGGQGDARGPLEPTTVCSASAASLPFTSAPHTVVGSDAGRRAN